jgi:hypothetical protein
MAEPISIPLTTIQIIKIREYGSVGNYPSMYRYVADEIAAGRIAVEGGKNSRQYYWFDQATSINAGDTASPASVFIRAATTYGLAIDGKDTSATNIQNISNAIGRNVFIDLDENRGSELQGTTGSRNYRVRSPISQNDVN